MKFLNHKDQIKRKLESANHKDAVCMSGQEHQPIYFSSSRGSETCSSASWSSGVAQLQEHEVHFP